MDEKYIYALKFLRERGNIPVDMRDFINELCEQGFGEYLECSSVITTLTKKGHAKWATKDNTDLLITNSGLNRLNFLEEQELSNKESINVFSGSNSGTIIQQSSSNKTKITPPTKADNKTINNVVIGIIVTVIGGLILWYIIEHLT